MYDLPECTFAPEDFKVDRPLDCCPKCGEVLFPTVTYITTPDGGKRIVVVCKTMIELVVGGKVHLYGHYDGSLPV